MRSIVDLKVLDYQTAIRLQVDAASAQAALMESLNGRYVEHWPGDYETLQPIKESIIEMGKIARGES